MSSSPTKGGGGAGAPGEGVALVDVTMPQMGVSVAEGTVVDWRVGVGDPIEADQTICEISTDKIDSEVPAPVSGVVAEILVAPDTTVDVGTVLARIAPEGDGAGGAASGGGAGGGVASAGTGGASVASAGAGGASVASAGAGDGGVASGGAGGGGASTPDVAQNSGAPARVNGSAPPGVRAAPAGRQAGRYSPVVQRIAAEHGVDLATLVGTGRGGRVRKQDVLAAVAAGPATEEPPLHIESPYRPEPEPVPAPAPATAPADRLPRVRRQIGERMKRSLETAAHCTTWIEVDMSRVEAVRARLGLTALPIVARGVIDALREHPALNAWLEGERYTRHTDVNLGIAVSLGDDGLIVPVVAKAQELAAEGLAARIKDLARRARSRALTPDEVQGGTFTITNPGQYGSIMATPIINQPQVAILDLEAIVKRPVVITDTDGNDSIAIRPMTILGLSWDHRALDGAEAAQFLATVKRNLEHL